jgi:hypothetical protein
MYVFTIIIISNIDIVNNYKSERKSMNKKREKKVKKSVDRRGSKWYYIQALARGRTVFEN